MNIETRQSKHEHDPAFQAFLNNLIQSTSGKFTKVIDEKGSRKRSARQRDEELKNMGND